MLDASHLPIFDPDDVPQGLLAIGGTTGPLLFRTEPQIVQHDLNRTIASLFEELELLREKAKIIDGDFYFPTQRCPGYTGFIENESGRWSPCMICSAGINCHGWTAGAKELMQSRQSAIPPDPPQGDKP